MVKNKFITGILLFLTPLLQAQNYVASGNEMGIFGPVSFGTSTSWVTARTATPGYFSWTIGSGNYTGTNDTHHVNGYVKKYGSEPFVFPVGSGTDLRTLSISAASNPTDVYAVAWITGDPTTITDPTNGNAYHPVTAVSGSISVVSTVGQWDWQAVRGTGEGLTITVSIPQLIGAEFADASKLRLVGWNGTSWESLGTSGASGITENSTLTGTMKVGIQAIGIGVVTASDCLDTDGDGVPDKDEFAGDTDGDGVRDYLDTDDDGDGILTKDEHPNPNGDCDISDAWDSDANGIPDYMQPNNGNPNLKDDLEVFNGISPDNGNPSDGVFVIRNIELYPDNFLKIYDRWGESVYETNGYNQNGNVFTGETAGATRYGQGTRLKEDTYFYVLKFRKNASEKYREKAGYLYIKRN
ncbi:MAG: gliding motility-associated C-terminal domain-containing protein [Flavobacterium sp.]